MSSFTPFLERLPVLTLGLFQCWYWLGFALPAAVLTLLNSVVVLAGSGYSVLMVLSPQRSHFPGVNLNKDHTLLWCLHTADCGSTGGFFFSSAGKQREQDYRSTLRTCVYWGFELLTKCSQVLLQVFVLSPWALRTSLKLAFGSIFP